MTIEPVRQPLVGLDGRPLVEVKDDLSDLNDPDKLNQTVEDLLLAAGRMLRDGKSLKQIRVELHGESELGVTEVVMERFAQRGLALLQRRIAEGREPEETIQVQMVDPLLIEADKQAMDDALAYDPTGQNNVSPEYLRED